MSYQLKCTQFASKKKLVIIHSFRDFERERSYKTSKLLQQRI